MNIEQEYQEAVGKLIDLLLQANLSKDEIKPICDQAHAFYQLGAKHKGQEIVDQMQAITSAPN